VVTSTIEGSMTKPLASVLIPCFNAEAFIGETLEHVFRQTWPNIEVVVIDDGSSDRSAAEVARFSRSNLIFIARANAGAAAARNGALRRCSGAFIQFLDADDLIAPSKIELQMGRLIERPTCVATSEWTRFHGRPEDAAFSPDDGWQDLDPLDWLALSRKDGLGMMFPAMWLVPRPVVDAAGPWVEDLSLADDTEYYTRVVLASERVLFCPGARCYYRSGVAGSLSGRKSSAAWASQFKVTELCQSYVLAREDSERMRRTFALTWQHHAHACYPYDRDLAETALARACALHSVRIRPDGGAVFRALSKLLGWRLARRLQVASGRP
jgi:glycosyltransferase involved in cell wall biosynthesis